ncbi:MAG: suppressor of fused domain protein, partial [Deltaproteobacteria bacterium]|nr:suppressor of fused domain protein [Deltaproteobacteria bacterium]
KPYICEDELEYFTANNKKVNFLLAIPISDSEFEYINNNGYKEFENKLKVNNTDICKIDRQSIV